MYILFYNLYLNSIDLSKKVIKHLYNMVNNLHKDIKDKRSKDKTISIRLSDYSQRLRL